MTRPAAPAGEVERLIESLRSTVDTGQRSVGGGSIGYGSDGKIKCEMWGCEPIMALRNPDGPAAADLIEALAKERDEAREERDALHKEAERHFVQALSNGQAAQVARAEAEKLRGALEPFAKAGSLFDSEPEDPRWCVSIYRPAAGDDYHITDRHLRAARSALSGEGGEG